MRDLGHVEGQSFALEDSARQLPGNATERAAKLASLPVDLFLVQGTGTTRAAQAASSTTPVVMAVISDAVGDGAVPSLGKPGGNVTGLSNLNRELTGKRIELLKEIVPGGTRVAVLWSPADPALPPIFAEAQTAAGALGLQVQSLEAVSPTGLSAAFEAAAREHADALLVVTTGFVVEARQQIVNLAATHRLPAMYSYRDFVEVGGLVNYGPSFVGMYRRAAYFVDRILKGAKPADLPVEQPREFEFVLNLKTAQALGLTIPQHVLLQATEIIQ
jgi:putative tryptophan/tyrosine transport system substrate-binding protein